MRYTKDHAWIEIDGDVLTIGATEHALEGMDDIRTIELPIVGRFYSKSDVMAIISDGDEEYNVCAPVSGEIVEINELISETPESFMNASKEDNWVVKMYVEDESELNDTMDQDEYDEFLLAGE